jgi:hypothetical protein
LLLQISIFSFQNLPQLSGVKLNRKNRQTGRGLDDARNEDGPVEAEYFDQVADAAGGLVAAVRLR